MVEPSQTIGIDLLLPETELWGPSVDGEEIRRLRSRYQERVGDDEWDDVVETAASDSRAVPRLQATKTGGSLDLHSARYKVVRPSRTRHWLPWP